MTYPVVPTVPTGVFTVSTQLTDQGNVKFAVPTTFVNIEAVTLTNGTPVSVYTPTTGKKFRLLGYALSSVAAGAILFEDGSGTEILRTTALAANGNHTSPPMGEGITSTTANNHLYLDTTAGTPGTTSVVNGFIALDEV